MNINEYQADGDRPAWVTNAIQDAIPWLDVCTPEWKALRYVAENAHAYIALTGESDAVERGIRMALAEIQRMDRLFGVG